MKAILVVDIPDGYGDICDNKAIVTLRNGKLGTSLRIHNVPLKPLPQKKEVNLPNDRVWSKDEIMAYTHGIPVGYNECLDDLGETE